MSSANRETPDRPTPTRGSGSVDRAGGPSTIRAALPPPPDALAAGKGTPAPAPAGHTILGYTPPLEPAASERLPEDLLPAGFRVGDYEIVELIGVGGMGSVYAARNPIIDRQVAIKVIASHLCRDPDVVQQFVIEARAANQIANRHVVDIHTLGTLSDGRPYLVMQLLRGETLTQRLSYGPLEVDDAVPILDQIAEAAEAAHAVPIVHRDLKPDNVFLEDGSDGPQVKILDFGIARLAGTAGGEDEQGVRGGGILAGTPHYMAPEQARAQLVGTPADLYAVGLIAFEMLAGRPVFDADTAEGVLVAHMKSTPPLLRALRPDVPPDLERLIDRLLAKDPSERPTATDVRRALRALYRPATYPRVVPAVELPLGERARLWLQRPRNRVLIAAQVIVGLVILAAYLFIGGDDRAGAVAPGSGAAPSGVESTAAAPSPAAPSGAESPASRPEAAAPSGVEAPAAAPSTAAPSAEAPSRADSATHSGESASAPTVSGAAPSQSKPRPAGAGAASRAAPSAPEPVVAPLEGAPAGRRGARPADRDAPIRDPF